MSSTWGGDRADDPALRVATATSPATHPCHAFTVMAEVPPRAGYLAGCSCGWSSGGWLARNAAVASLGRHLDRTLGTPVAHHG